MHLSEARQELYDRALEHLHEQEGDEMSRMKFKHGYHAGETESVEAISFSTAKAGYDTQVEVVYRTGKDQLARVTKNVPPSRTHEEDVIKAVQEMMAATSITYPE